MSGPRVAYLLGEEGFARIYGPDQRAQVAELVGGEPPFATPVEARRGDPRLADVEVLLSGWGVEPLDEETLAAMPRLRAVLDGAGSVRGIVTPALLARGVEVSSAAEGNAVPVANYATSMIHLSLKRVWEFLRSSHPRSETEKDRVAGAYGATVGIVALGHVGRLVAERLRGEDLRLLAHDPYVTPDEARELGVDLVGLDDLFRVSNVVTLHVPLYDGPDGTGTQGLVGRELLASMGERATLVNTSRGAVVRTDELAEVLAARPDLQAVLDVTDPEPLPADHPLRSLPNVVLTPHVAGSLGPECHRLGQMMVDELRRFLGGDPLRWRVDVAHLEHAAMP